MRRSALAAALAAVTALTCGACGKELARVDLRGEGGAATSVAVQAGTRLSFWTSLDADFAGELVARYDVEAYESGRLVGKTSCDPFDVSIKTNAREVTSGGRRSVAWSGKMRCELTAPSKGLLSLHVRLVFVRKPDALVVRDMSLVVKR